MSTKALHNFGRSKNRASLQDKCTCLATATARCRDLCATDNPHESLWIPSRPVGRALAPEAWPSVSIASARKVATPLANLRCRLKIISASVSNPSRRVMAQNCWCFIAFVTAGCSWNAAKRALALGYKNVAWYPDGTDGWEAAELPLQEAKPEPASVQ
jgi:hypothetical protein